MSTLTKQQMQGTHMQWPSLERCVDICVLSYFLLLCNVAETSSQPQVLGTHVMIKMHSLNTLLIKVHLCQMHKYFALVS